MAQLVFILLAIIGLIFCIYLIKHKRSYHSPTPEAINHYTNKRDNITESHYENEPEEDEEESTSSGFSIGGIVGGFVTIVVGITLFPTIKSTMDSACSMNNTTMIGGTCESFTGLTTIFYALGIMGAGIALAVGGLKRAGVM
jgi:hypothetical protein